MIAGHLGEILAIIGTSDPQTHANTQLYTDVTRVNDLLSKTEKTGYDFGVIHTF